MDLDRRVRSRLHLPDYFVAAVDTDDDRPTGYLLQVEGCPNGPSWVEEEHTADGSMLLGKGWKAFARSRHLTRGQYLSFKYDGDDMLSVKIFRADGGCEDCYMESDSSSRSSCYDKEDDDEDREDSLFLGIFCEEEDQPPPTPTSPPHRKERRDIRRPQLSRRRKPVEESTSLESPQ